jgi:hypothetical protein
MTAFTGSIDCSPARLAVTRGGLHRLAEHVLAAGLYAASGEIGLVPAPGGFRTPPFGPDGWFLVVDGTGLVTGDAAATRRTALTTLRAAAEFAGVTPGAPAQVYKPATPLNLDEPLMIDPEAARLLAGWYQLGTRTTARRRATRRSGTPRSGRPAPSARSAP